MQQVMQGQLQHIQEQDVQYHQLGDNQLAGDAAEAMMVGSYDDNNMLHQHQVQDMLEEEDEEGEDEDDEDAGNDVNLQTFAAAQINTQSFAPVSIDTDAVMSEVGTAIGNQVATDGSSEIQLMPSSNERSVKRYSATNKAKKSPLSSGQGSKLHQRRGQITTVNNHHRKNSSQNMFEDFKGALRDELLSIDFN